MNKHGFAPKPFAPTIPPSKVEQTPEDELRDLDEAIMNNMLFRHGPAARELLGIMQRRRG